MKLETPLLSSLSPRTLRMVSGGVWHEEPRERTEVDRILTSYGIEPTEALLCFQEQFGGLEYQIRGRPEGWRFGLIGNGVDYLIESQFAKALDHRTEQLAFAIHYMSGEIFVDDYSGWIPIASSVRMVLESDAVIDEIVDAWETGVYVMLGHYARRDLSFNKALLQADREFITVSEASDQYTTWWVNERLRIIRRALYYSPEPQDCVELYAQDVTEARQLVAALIEQGVLKRDTEISCFPHPFDPTPVYQGSP
jgi:hypothetical protein